MTNQFNLLDEPFIPAVTLSGETVTLSLLEVFDQSSVLRRLGGELPTQSLAVFRMLLAILYRATRYETEEDWEVLLDRGLPVSKITTYLEQHRDRFWLFSEARPFMQVSGLNTSKGEASGLEKLIADVPNGSPFFTTRSGSALKRISFAEAARWLIHVHAFDPSGIRSGAVGDPQAKGGKGFPIGPSWAGQLGGVVLHGENLAQSLVVNSMPLERFPERNEELDIPVWELAEPHTAVRADFENRHPPGPISVLTWQSRRVRLVSDGQFVTGVVLCQGDRMTPQNRQSVETMSAWRFSEPQTKKFGRPTYMPRKHDPARGLWRNLPGILQSRAETKTGYRRFLEPETVRWIGAWDEGHLRRRLILEAIGMTYGSNEAVVDELTHDQLDLAAGLLGAGAAPVRDEIDGAVAATEQVAWLLGNLAANLAKASGERGDDAGAAAAQREQRAFFSLVDAPCRAWIEGLTSEDDHLQIRRHWEGVLRKIASSQIRAIVDQCPPAAVQGREVGKNWINAGHAERMAWAKLREILPMAFASEDSRYAELQPKEAL